MRDFKDKVAVITGAASGIGRGLAEQCIEEGMKVVLADIEQNALLTTAEELKSKGADTLAITTDVSKIQDIEELAHKTVERFGRVHLLFNNAGVGKIDPPVWESTTADWQWVSGVNLWGVIHGLRVFIPIMLRQESQCHIVNTASMAGLLSGPGWAIYRMTKYAVVSLSETLFYDLRQRNAKIKISVLCPGWVKTRIADSERNRPVELRNPPTLDSCRPEDKVTRNVMRESVESGMQPREVAEHVFKAIRAEQFYILTHPDWKCLVQERTDCIMNEQNPI